jgi:hypothetical protein
MWVLLEEWQIHLDIQILICHREIPFYDEKTNQLMFCREIFNAYCAGNKEHLSAVWGRPNCF